MLVTLNLSFSFLWIVFLVVRLTAHFTKLKVTQILSYIFVWKF